MCYQCHLSHVINYKVRVLNSITRTYFFIILIVYIRMRLTTLEMEHKQCCNIDCTILQRVNFEGLLQKIHVAEYDVLLYEFYFRCNYGFC